MQNGGHRLVFVVDANKVSTSRLEWSPVPQISEGEVLIAIGFSSLTFKDALVYSSPQLFGLKTDYVPGTDVVGTVIDSKSTKFSVGARVLVVSSDLGTSGAGGFAEYLRIDEGLVEAVPVGWSDLQAISIGIPGFTAALAIDRIQKHFDGPPESIVISGACGAVGAYAVEFAALLRVPEVTALSSTESCHRLLRKFGANQILHSDSLAKAHEMRLLPPRWNAAIDTVGGNVLANIIKSLRPAGKAIIVGMANSDKSEIHLAPFFLRAVSATGVNLQSQFGQESEALVALVDNLFPVGVLKSGTHMWTVNRITQVMDILLNRNGSFRQIFDLSTLLD